MEKPPPPMGKWRRNNAETTPGAWPRTTSGDAAIPQGCPRTRVTNGPSLGGLATRRGAGRASLKGPQEVTAIPTPSDRDRLPHPTSNRPPLRPDDPDGWV